MRRGFREWGHGLHLSQAGVGCAQRWGGTREGLQQWRPLCRSVYTHTHVHQNFTAPFFSLLTTQLRPVTPSSTSRYMVFIMSLRPLAEGSLPCLQTITVNTRFLLEPLTLTVHVRERGSHWHYRVWLPYMCSLVFIFTCFQKAMKTSHSKGLQWPACYHFAQRIFQVTLGLTWVIFLLSASTQLMPLSSVFGKFLIRSVAWQYLLRFF